MGVKWLRQSAKRAFAGMLRPLSDIDETALDYVRVYGKLPNLKQPRKFSEKIQHHKLFVRDPQMVMLVDKVRVKEHVAQMIGAQWTIPTLWHGPRVSRHELYDAPKPVAVKPNHSSGQVLFVRTNENLDAAARKANEWLRYDHSLVHREWAYGAVERQILIEPLIGGADALDDYKFWMFDGALRFVQVDRDRFTHHTRSFYSPAWARLNLAMNYPPSPEDTPAPRHFHEMTIAAEKLSAGFRFVRVDFYDTVNGPLFGGNDVCA